MRKFIFCCTFVFHIVMGAAIGHAQTVDPSILEFDPSPDHASSLLAGYELRIRVAGSSPVLQVVPLGKPDVWPDGKVRLNLASILDAYPAAGPVYDASVVAIGAGDEAPSASSNAFSFSPCTFTVTPEEQTVTSDAGGFAVLVNARNGCSWGAGAGSGWLSISGSSTASGSGTAGYSVQGNSSGIQRTTVVTVAGHPITVVQLATSSSTSTSLVTTPPPSAPINLRVLH